MQLKMTPNSHSMMVKDGGFNGNVSFGILNYLEERVPRGGPYLRSPFLGPWLRKALPLKWPFWKRLCLNWVFLKRACTSQLAIRGESFLHYTSQQLSKSNGFLSFQLSIKAYSV